MENKKWQYLKARLGAEKNFIQILLTFLIAGTILPAVLLSVANVQQYRDGAEPLSTSFTEISVVLLILGVIAVLMGVVFLPMKSLSYLLDRKETDMIFALPVTRRRRFWSDFLSGIFCYVLPFLVLTCLSMLVILIPALREAGSSFFGYHLSGGKMAVQLFLDLNVVNLFSYIFVFFVGETVGNRLDFLAYLMVLLITIPLDFCSLAVALNGAMGTTSIPSVYAPALLTNPFGFLVGVFLNVKNEVISSDFWKYLIPALMMGLFLFLAEKMHEKRKAEQTGKGIVFRWVSCFLLLSLGIIMGNFVNTAVGIVSSFVLFLVLMLYMQRGKVKAKTTGKLFLLYLGGILLTVLFGVLARTTGAFGMKNYRPSAASIDSVELSASYIPDQVFHSRKAIEIIRKYDPAGAAEDSEDENFSEEESADDSTVFINYRKKDGTRVYRYENMSDSELNAFVRELCSTPEYVQNQEENFEAMVRDVSQYGSFIGTVYTSPEQKISMVTYSEEDFTEGEYRISEKEIPAFLTDVKTAAEKDYQDGSTYDHAVYSLDGFFLVSKDDTNLISVMKKYGILDEKGNPVKTVSEDTSAEDTDSE